MRNFILALSGFLACSAFSVCFGQTETHLAYVSIQELNEDTWRTLRKEAHDNPEAEIVLKESCFPVKCFVFEVKDETATAAQVTAIEARINQLQLGAEVSLLENNTRSEFDEHCTAARRGMPTD